MKSSVINKSVSVTKAPKETFDLFTARIGEWWPREYEWAKGAGMVMEHRRGGRLYQKAPDGSEYEIGKVRVFSPPKRVVFTWIQPDWESETEVEVTFTAEPGGTRVDLTHRGWEKIGKWGADFRNDYSTGWDDILSAFTDAAAGKSKKETPKPNSAGNTKVIPARNIEPSVLRALRSPGATGSLYVDVSDEASAIGIRLGDILVSFGGIKTVDSDSFYNAWAAAHKAKNIPVVLNRAGKQVKFKIAERLYACLNGFTVNVAKGKPVLVRPKATVRTLETNSLTKPMEIWLKALTSPYTGAKQSRVGWVHQDLRKVTGGLRLRTDMGVDEWGHHRHSIEVIVDPKNLSPKAGTADLRDASNAKAPMQRSRSVFKATHSGKKTWWVVQEMGPGASKKLVKQELTSEGVSRWATSLLAMFMPQAPGATFHYTPIGGYPRAIVCVVPEEITIEKKTQKAWRFDHIGFGTTVGSTWIDENRILVKDTSVGPMLIGSTRDEAIAKSPKRLQP